MINYVDKNEYFVIFVPLTRAILIEYNLELRLLYFLFFNTVIILHLHLEKTKTLSQITSLFAFRYFIVEIICTFFKH